MSPGFIANNGIFNNNLLVINYCTNFSYNNIVIHKRYTTLREISCSFAPVIVAASREFVVSSWIMCTFWFDLVTAKRSAGQGGLEFSCLVS